MREEFIVLGIIVVAIAAVYFAIKSLVGPKLADQVALACIMEVEQRLFVSTNVGQEKLTLAVSFLSDRLPAIVQMLYPEQEVIRIIQVTFDKCGKSITEKLKLAAAEPVSAITKPDSTIELSIEP